MDYQLEMLTKNLFLHFRVTGKNTSEVALLYLQEIYQVCQSSPLRGVLIEENLDGPRLELIDIFEIVSQISLRVHPLRQIVAYVDINPNHSQRDLKFAETVAINRGLQVKVFDDAAMAEAWLIQVLQPPALTKEDSAP